MGRPLAVGVIVLACSTPVLAQQNLEPITDRNYSIDLYQGAVLGSARIVGMGGASVAVATGSAGILVNPASVASWPATSTGTWDWDFHLDYLNRLPGSDLDNNGIEDPDTQLELDPFFTGGLIGRWGVWALGATVSRNAEIAPTESPDEPDLEVVTQVFRLAAGAGLFGETLAVGVAVKIGSFNVAQDQPSGMQPDLFGLTGAGVEVGAVWSPHKKDWRIGASLGSPIVGGDELDVGDTECDPNDCFGYILPEAVTAPWQLAIGGAWHFGPSRWNQKFGADWRDERYWLVAADVLITGSNDDGHGLGAFALGQLQPSGRDVSLSVRLGAEYEWVPGRLRVRAGSYWEPSRVSGVSGRLHGTVGIDVRVWSFCFWEARHRLMLGVTGDGAEGYGNGGLSIGFWH